MSGSLRLVRILAWRRLVDRPLRSALTTVGVAVGVAFLFSMMSLNAQLASSVNDTAALFESPRLLQVTPASPGGLPEDLATKLDDDPRVEAAAPLLVTRSKASIDGREAGVFVLAGSPDSAGVMPQDAMPSMDAFELSDDGGDILLSGTLARRLHAELGDEVTMHASAGKTPLRVGAVASLPALDRINGGMVVGMFLDPAQAVFGRPDRVDQIMLLAAPDADVDALRRDIAVEIEGVGLVGRPGETAGVENVDFAAVQLTTNLLAAVLVMAALVLVFHTMSMATAERRTEIALARSLGSTRRQLLAVTLAEAGLLGVGGTVVGLAAGGVLARLVVPLARVTYVGISPVDLPTDVSLQVVPALVAAVAGVAGAVLGAVLPARAAARAAPIDAFRPAANYEWRDPARPARRLALAALGAALYAGGTVTSLRSASAEGAPELVPTDPAFLLPGVAVYAGALILVPLAIPFAVQAVSGLLGRLSSTTGRLAADALRSNPRRTRINVVSLMLPVSLVVASGLGLDGGAGKIRDLARAAVGAPLNVDAESYIGGFGPDSAVASQPLAATDQAVLEAVPGVRAVLPYENANVALPDATRGVIYAVPLTAAERAGVPDMIQAGRAAEDSDAFTQALAAGEIAASRFAARSLDLEPGSSLTLPTPTGPRTFTVGALFEDWAFQGTFYVDLDTYRSVWGDDRAHRYAIVPAAGTPVDVLHERVEAAVTAAAMPAQVTTRDEAVATLVTNTTVVFPIGRGMMLAGLVFGALALANAAFTAVTERRWLIALQRTLGMTNRQITRSLALEAVASGLVAIVGAVILGLSIGVVLIRVLYNQVAVTVDIAIPWTMTGVAAVLGIVVALGATWFPRRTAKRTTIIEALRFE